jgi:polysaccharide export outer membrane protein
MQPANKTVNLITCIFNKSSNGMNPLKIIVILLMMAGLFSCKTSKPVPVQYLQGSFDTTKLSRINLPDPVIQKGDLLSIVVFSDNPKATIEFNQPVVVNAATVSVTDNSINNGAAASSTGYLVDQEGNIIFPVIGVLHVEGLVKKQLKELLDSKLVDSLLKHPYYAIRFLNFKIAVMGEVTKPNVYSIPGEKISILEAIAMSGDITYYGRKDNVQVVREINGVRRVGLIDLTKPDVFASPYYYLQQNDMVVVDQQIKKKRQANDQTTARNIGIAASVVSTIAILISVLKN